MCKHNEEEHPCVDCCYEQGKEDAMDGEPKNCEYKNFDQCDAYHDGYADGLREKPDDNCE